MENDFAPVPANKEDFDTMYHNIIWHMAKAGISSTTMGYVADLWKAAKKKQNDHNKPK